MMRPINKKAQVIMDRLTTGLSQCDTHQEIDNSDGVYMPVHIDWIGDTPDGDIFAVAHYYTQNGDLMCDPLMSFLRAADGRYYPTDYRLDGLGVYRESVHFDEDGRVIGYNPREQRDEAIFAGTWMQNIKMQQFRRGSSDEYA